MSEKARRLIDSFNEAVTRVANVAFSRRKSLEYLPSRYEFLFFKRTLCIGIILNASSIKKCI